MPQVEVLYRAGDYVALKAQPQTRCLVCKDQQPGSTCVYVQLPGKIVADPVDEQDIVPAGLRRQYV